MENERNTSPEGYIDVRFNLIYSVFMVLAGIAFTVWALLAQRDPFEKYWFLIMGLLFLFHGLYAISGKKYIRYDPNGKKISFFGIFGIADRKVKFESLFFKGKDLYRVINGKTRYINIIISQCNKEDLEILTQEISKVK